jgi:hypothetical protein
MPSRFIIKMLCFRNWVSCCFQERRGLQSEHTNSKRATAILESSNLNPTPYLMYKRAQHMDKDSPTPGGRHRSQKVTIPEQNYDMNNTGLGNKTGKK